MQQTPSCTCTGGCRKCPSVEVRNARSDAYWKRRRELKVLNGECHSCKSKATHGDLCLRHYDLDRAKPSRLAKNKGLRIIHCLNCGKPNHNSATCQEPKVW